MGQRFEGYLMVKYNWIYCIHLIYGLANLKSVSEISEEWGINKSTFFKWLKKHKEFEESFKIGNRIKNGHLFSKIKERNNKE